MGEVTDTDLYRRTQRLLVPGDIDLQGLIVHTDLGSDADIEMMNATIATGNAIASAAGFDPANVYVYSGNDDPEFASNQHQGLTMAEDSFVWECQQLLRQGSFDLVFYFESGIDPQPAISTIEANGYRVQHVETP